MRKTLRDTAIDLIGSAVWLSLLCVLGMAPGVFAQGVSGRIVGSATHSSGAAVANAHVTVTDQDTGVSTSVVTDSRGEYRANNLPPGNYQVQVEAPGMQTVVSKGNVVTVDNATVVQLTLQVGSAAQSITVTAAAPLVDTTSSSLGEVLDARDVTNLPLNGRVFSSWCRRFPAPSQPASAVRRRRQRAPDLPAPSRRASTACPGVVRPTRWMASTTWSC